MCLDIRKICDCGEHCIQFHFRNNVMDEKVLINLFCPLCSVDIELDINSMLYDNGWIIEYEMDMARFFAITKLGLQADSIWPGFLFDEGYITWLELYPGEKIDIQIERQEIIKLLDEDKKRYLTKLTNWNISRIKHLKQEGWRKVQHA